MLRVVLLSEVHDDLVSVSTIESLFGPGSVDDLVSEYGSIEMRRGYLGKGSRKRARKRRDVSVHKMRRAEKLLSYIAWLPWVKFAGVTGSVSYENARSEDDIDILLVVQSKRLWLTRLVEQVIYRVAGVRRSFGAGYVKDKLCINFYVSEEHLDLRDPGRSDFLTALELAMMKPVYNEQYLSNLYSENEWIFKFFKLKEVSNAESKKIRRVPVISNIVDVSDIVVMTMWKWYMRVLRHPIDESVVESDRVQFVDRKVWEERERKLNELLKRYDVG